MEVGKIRTYTGIRFDIVRPSPNDVCVEDIAHQLSLECRWGGATKRHYSVAEHSVWVARYAKRLVPSGMGCLASLYALLHDAHEAYVKDVPTPMKKLYPSYEAMAYRIDVAIRQRFNLPEPSANMLSAVKMADEYAAWCEARMLMAACRKGGTSGTEPPIGIEDNVGMLKGISFTPSMKHYEEVWLREFNLALSVLL